MTPQQREAAERLADALTSWPAAFSPTDLMLETAALLRELAAEPVQEPVAAELPAPQLLVESAQGFVEGWTRSQVRSAINLALLKRRYAAPQQPMRCPEDGGACGAGGYCRPEPQQRKPLSDEQINRLDTEAIHGGPDSQYAFRFARAVEKAHGITGEQE